MHRTDAELRRLRVCAGSARLNAGVELATQALCRADEDLELSEG